MNSWLYCVARIQGRRLCQEDNYDAFVPPKQLHAGDLLLVLADGMGGERAGDRASTLVVCSFIDAYAAIPTCAIPQRLRRALDHANRALALEIAEDSRALAGMGCTLVAVVLEQTKLYWISVGDSPLWLWRSGCLMRLNQDHSCRPVLARRAAAGEISGAETESHPGRGGLLSAVTGNSLTLVDLSSEPCALLPGDRVLLASDGLLTLSETEITARLSEPTALPCQHLLDAVLAAAHPYQDNATVILAQAAAWKIGGRWQAWLVRLVLAALLILGGFWWCSAGRGISLSHNVLGKVPNLLAAIVTIDWEHLP
jgi:serine/threonine protein phosphatase PrpC